MSLLKYLIAKVRWRHVACSAAVVGIGGVADWFQEKPFIAHHPFEVATVVYIVGLLTNSIKDKLQESDASNH